MQPLDFEARGVILTDRMIVPDEGDKEHGLISAEPFSALREVPGSDPREIQPGVQIVGIQVHRLGPVEFGQRISI
ncbi:hypothetical protein VP06_05475 [Methylobacterium aquaticum]|uniref:Uncharacterized protein n=1 Tax=Methylobacterium aquaticum TaxID=270351 RepID=A0A0J6VIC4_9HYPH|nr:hypothetical protein VP06_05475 [Methylobacterium aquaticum]